ncbi:SusD/RagB family nutrient-binding outer membrane lipoprotein [Flavobacterium sp. J27]|uniref:SusD/RagB family nutrient-binding outer membrane lipoprotein n=1 Tax=Flavobacterium sp. J27 TaxID=2060419 RepID=UPI00103008B8|nr:SusD/RagB family nutrient-binding outer membrane lipoprotein [Flavobacterium sp. J27]
MKKYLIILLGTLAVSCASDETYDSLNKDQNNPPDVPSRTLFTGATKNLFDQMESTNVNTNVYRLFAQYWTETTYIDESNYDLTTRNIPSNHWTEMFTNVLYDLKDAKNKPDTDTDGKKGMIEVLEVYTWQQLVDTFGNIPYSEALLGRENQNPAYDDAQTIYQDLLVRIDAAILKLSSATDNGFEDADLIFNGDLGQWIKFANSLKFKLAMRIADVSSLATLSQTAAQDAYNAGLIASNSDNVTLSYGAATPNTNPLWVDLVQSGRQDFVVANTIVDYMNTLSDPRRAFYFDDNLGTGSYVGGPYGDNNSFFSYTHVGELMHQPTFRGVLMDYSEIEFLLAEAAERGYAVGGTAETHYNNGITASMEDWGVATVDASAYLLNPSVAYTTATGTWREKIGFQFWLAMYNRGFEGWSVYRKYDAPAMNVAADSGLDVPKRYTYPLREQTINITNYSAASAAIGGDELDTPIFWDVN